MVEETASDASAKSSSENEIQEQAEKNWADTLSQIQQYMAPSEKVRRYPRHSLQGHPTDPIYRNRDQISKVLDLFTERLRTNERTATKNWSSIETFEVFSLKAAF